MAFDHKKYQNIIFDAGLTLYGASMIGFAYQCLKEPIKTAIYKHKIKRALKKLEKTGNEMLILENEKLEKENKELYEKNQELLNQIPKTTEA